MIDALLTRLIIGATRLVSGVRPDWRCPPQGDQQRIYFANHGSHLDFLAIWAALPADRRKLVRPVAAKDYWERTALRRRLIHRVFNGVLISRGGEGHRAAAGGLRSLHVALDEGFSLIIFPEGTRGGDEPVSPFKAGLHHLAKHAPGAELVPTYLENLNRVLPKGECLPVPLIGRVTFGVPIHLAPDESGPEFLERARRALEQLNEHTE